MKYLLLLVVLLSACGPSREEIEKRQKTSEAESRFHPGDIVHIKPDSARAAIISVVVTEQGCGCLGSSDTPPKIKYKVRDKKGNTEVIPESLIFTEF